MNVFANGYMTSSVCDVLLNSPINVLTLDLETAYLLFSNKASSVIKILNMPRSMFKILSTFCVY